MSTKKQVPAPAGTESDSERRSPKRMEERGKPQPQAKPTPPQAAPRPSKPARKVPSPKR